MPVTLHQDGQSMEGQQWNIGGFRIRYSEETDQMDSKGPPNPRYIRVDPGSNVDPNSFRVNRTPGSQQLPPSQGLGDDARGHQGQWQQPYGRVQPQGTQRMPTQEQRQGHGHPQSQPPVSRRGPSGSPVTQPRERPSEGMYARGYGNYQGQSLGPGVQNQHGGMNPQMLGGPPGARAHQSPQGQSHVPSHAQSQALYMKQQTASEQTGVGISNMARIRNTQVRTAQATVKEQQPLTPAASDSPELKTETSRAQTPMGPEKQPQADGTVTSEGGGNSATGGDVPSQENPASALASPAPTEPKRDLSAMDATAIFDKLYDMTKACDKEPEPEPPLEETFEQFGRTIADILQMESEILECCQLIKTEDGTFFTNGTEIDQQRLDKMTDVSSRLFEDVTTVSEEMHKMTAALPPFYTRYMPYFRNLKMVSGRTTSFSHTAGPELAVSQHLVRLQNEFRKSLPKRRMQ